MVKNQSPKQPQRRQADIFFDRDTIEFMYEWSYIKLYQNKKVNE